MGRPKPLIQDIFKRGQEVIVQVIKEGIGTKGPTLSTYVSIAGRYLVLMPGLNRIGGALLGSAKGFLVVWALASLIALVRPHLKRVERDTPVAKLDLKESYAVQTASKTNLVTRLREGGLQDEAETVRKRLGKR